MGTSVQGSPQLEELQKAVEHEVYSRLTADPCETCGRGKDAEKIAATALAKLVTDFRRLKMAEERNHPQATEEAQANPLSLVATIQKLPHGPSRRTLLAVLEGQAISLTDAVRRLRAEEEEAEEESGQVLSG